MVHIILGRCVGRTVRDRRLFYVPEIPEIDAKRRWSVGSELGRILRRKNDPPMGSRRKRAIERTRPTGTGPIPTGSETENRRTHRRDPAGGKSQENGNATHYPRLYPSDAKTRPQIFAQKNGRTRNRCHAI